MKRYITCTFSFSSIVLLACAFSAGQETQYAAEGVGNGGAYSLPSLSGGGIDILNLGNLNAYVTIPIIQKAGRGSPYTYVVSFNSSIWHVASVSGVQTWQPDPQFGWDFSTPTYRVNNGYMGSQIVQSWTQPCDPSHNNWNPVSVQVYSFFIFHDKTGTTHPFNLTTSNYGGGCAAVSAPPMTGTAVATDGSGYTLNASGGGGNIVGPDGKTLDLSGALATTSTDANGNEVTQTTQTNQVITDTMGQIVLTISGTNPVLLQPAGTGQPYKIHYTSMQVKAHFPSCSVADYTNPSASLITSIDLPDGTSYSFSYEGTPNNPGYTTARLTKITLPTGGSISYSYPNSNISCVDGTTLSLNRTVDPGNQPNQWSYVRNNVSGNQWITTITTPPDPANSGSASDVTVINFSQDSNTNVTPPTFFETQRQVYQGASNLLMTTLKCYNANYASCATATVTTPITQMDSYTTWPGGTPKTNLTETKYNGYGLVSETKEYDYGVTTGSAPSSTLLRRDTVTTYASLGSIVDHPATVTIKDGSGNVKALTTYSYDQGTPISTCCTTPQHVAVSGSRGNLTTIARQVSGNATFYKRYTYYDTGMLSTETDWGTTTSGGPNVTTYNYPDASSTCGNTFATTVTLPLLGTTPASTYDCGGGVPTKTVDINGNATNFTYDTLWRKTSVSYPDLGQDSYSYGTNPPSVTKTSKITSTSNLVSETVSDGLGRPTTAETTSDPSGTDYVVTSYDALGRVASVTNPYRSTTDPTYGVTQYTYDALGRTTKVTNPDNSAIQTSYSQAAVQVQNEATRTRISQSDGLGRLASVCEVSSATQMGTGGSPSACGQDIAATGFLTAYSYDVLGNLTGVTQGSQTRSYAYDEISRLTSESNPESGTTTYAYDSCSVGDLCNRTRPRANQTNPSVTTSTSYVYDALHRVTSTSYNDGSPAMYYSYDVHPDWGMSNITNVKGRLVQANNQYVGTAGSGAMTVFSYDSMGRVTQELQQTPADAPGGYSIYSTYDLLGDKTSVNNTFEGVTYTYSFDAAARLSAMQSSLVDANHPGTLLTVTQYNPLGEMQQGTFGNGIARNMAYDNRGRLTSQTDGSIYSFTLGYTADSNILTGNDSTNGNWGYTYDDFGRVATSSKTGQSFNYQYDRYGNRWQQNAPQGGPAPQYSFDANNHISGSGVTYDAAGNVMNDGFHSYSYDGENRLISVDGGSTASYVYDAFGNRVRSTVSGSTNDYLFDDQDRVITQLGNGTNWYRSELYAGGMHVATYSNSTTFFDHSDWLGTVRERSYPNGTAAVTCTNVAFGDASSCTGSDGSPVHFTALEHDNESNLEHTLFRQYSSTEGRWSTPDPAGMSAVDPANPQSWNRYAYVMNSPLNTVDPAGLAGYVMYGNCLFQQYDYFVDGTYDSSQYFYIGCGGNVTCPPETTAQGMYLGSPCSGIPVITSCPSWANCGQPPPDQQTFIALATLGMNGNPCKEAAYNDGALHVAIDAVGLIPEGGLIARKIGNYAGWRGRVAIQQGTKTIQAVKTGAGIASTANGASDTSTIGSAQTANGIVGLIPGAGTVSSLVGMGLDILRANSEWSKCQ